MKRSAMRVSLLLLMIPALSPAAEQLPGQATAQRPLHASALLIPASDFAISEVYPERRSAPDDAVVVAPWLVLEASWAELEPVEGQLSLESLTRSLAEARRGDAPVVLLLRGGHPAHGGFGAGGWTGAVSDVDEADVAAWRRAWRDALREIARAAGPYVDWYLLDDLLPPPGPRGPAEAAFEIKLASNVIRAEDPGAAVALRVGAVDELALLGAAFREVRDLEPYVDAVSLTAGEAVSVEDLSAARGLLLEVAPGASLWVESRPGAAVASGELLALTMEGLAGGADLVIFETGGGASAAAAAQALLRLGEQLPPTLGSSPQAGAGVRVAQDAPNVRWQRYFDEENFREVVVYWAPGTADERREAELLFKTALRRGYRVIDPLSGQLRYARSEPATEDEVLVRVPLTRQPRVILVTRQKFSPGFDIELEEAEVRGERRLTAEEIIAAHQRFQEFQDDRLMSVSRESEINLRFRYGLVTGTADLTLRGSYFWDRQTGSDWVVREKFFNGVRLNWDKLPELPFVNQERAVQVPLRLDLNQRYRYERDGEEEIEGRSCWRLRFEPVVDDVSLYKGRVWIDQRTGAMVKMTTIQTNLEPPLISDEQTQIFHPYEGPDGTEYWLADGGEGQQIYTVQGGNLVIQRKISFTPPKINAPGFYAERDDAYASDLQMLRKTDEGFKWLSKSEDGSREVLEEGDPDQWFALVGAIDDEATDGVTPLAGVNYTNIDFLDRGLIFNLFFAGVLANVSISDPSFLGGRLDAGAILTANALKGTEKNFFLGEEIESERVERQTQTLTLTAGYPLGDFLKARGIVGFEYNSYSEDDETGDGFVLPEDHLESSVALELAYDRQGWGVLGRHSWSRRSDWEPWGPEGSPIDEAEAERFRDYTKWSVGLQKSFFLPYFQKIEIAAEYMAGTDLDRFSAFDFGFFSGTRVNGFSGSGIRFDEGTVAELEYSFNIQEVIRFDLELNQAWVRDERLSPDNTSHLGVGLAANFVGPWRTLVRLDVGYALKSDLEEVEGDLEYLLVVLRLF